MNLKKILFVDDFSMEIPARIIQKNLFKGIAST